MTVAKLEPRKGPPETLWEALCAAQSEFRAIVKDTKGARGNYAPLDAVLDIVRPILNKHSLVLTQPTFIDGETLFVRSTLVHSVTGEQTSGEYPAGPLALQHQQLGAGVTYARRYSLLALLGVHPENEDDDGEKAGSAGSPSSDGRRRNIIINPDTGKKIDTENARNQRPEWDRFTDTVQGYVDSRDTEGLKAWYTSDKTARFVAGWVFRDQAEEHFEKAVDEIERRNAGRP